MRIDGRRMAWVALLMALVVGAWWVSRPAPQTPRGAPGRGDSGESPAAAAPPLAASPARAGVAPSATAPPPPPAAGERVATVEVVLPDGAPAAGAIVQYASSRATRAAGFEDRSVQSVVAGADGTVSITFPSSFPSGPMHVAAHAADGRFANREPLDVAPGARGVLRLSPTGRIEGRVVGDAPRLLDVRVLAYAAAWAEAPGSRGVPVRPDGTFEVDGVVGSVNLIAYATQRVPSSFWKGSLQPGDVARAELHVGGAAITRRVRLRLADDASPPAGTPMLYTSGNAGWTGASTDEAGVVRLAHVAPEAETRLVVYPIAGDSGAPITLRFEATIQPSAWPAEEPLGITLPSALGGVLDLVDAAGRPVRGLRSIVSTVEGDRRLAAAAATSDASGALDLSRTSVGLPAGDVELRTVDEKVLWRGRAPGAGARTQVVVRDLALVTVRLRDWAGRPVAVPWVAAAILETADGRDLDSERDPTFVDLSEPTWSRFTAGGEVTLAYEARGFRDPVVRVKIRGVGASIHRFAPGQTLDVEIGRESGAVELRAVDAAARPIPTVIRLTHASDASAEYMLKVDAPGGRTVAGLLPGRYRWAARGVASADWGQEGELEIVAGRSTVLTVHR